MKRFLHVTLAVALLVILCGVAYAAGKQEQKPVTLKWYQWWLSDPVRGANITFEIAEFQKLYPNIKIEPLASTNQAYWDRVALDIANGTEGDIVTLDTGAGMNSYNNQRPGGTFIALDKYIKGAVLPDGTNLEKDIVLLDQMKRDGKTIALPFIWFTAPDTAYRKSYLAKAGVDPAQLKTWDGYLAAVKKLSKPEMFGFGQPNDQEVLSRWWLMNFLWTAGGGIFKDEQPPYTADRLIFNSKENAYALEYLKSMIGAAGIQGEKSYWQLESLFSNGNLATMQIALWGIGRLNESMKDTFKNDVGLVPFPSVTIDGKVHDPVYVAWGNPLAISSKCKNPDAAFKFIAFLHSKEVQEKETNAAAPVNKLVMPWYKEHFPVEYQVVQDAQKYTFRQVPDLINWNQWDHIIQQTLNAALLGTKPVQQALDDGQTQMLELLK